MISGSYSVSPAHVDFNTNIILVNYVTSFGRPGRRTTSAWCVFDRRTKELSYTVERESADNLTIGFDDEIYLISATAIYAVRDLHQSSGVVTEKYKLAGVYSVDTEMDEIETFDIDLGHGKVSQRIRLGVLLGK